MKKIVIFTVCLVLLSITYAEKPLNSSKKENPPQNLPGTYQLVFGNIADGYVQTYLLDTTKGIVWHLVKDERKNLLFQKMLREDLDFFEIEKINFEIEKKSFEKEYELFHSSETEKTKK